MKNCLVFLTKMFPYGTGEEFIENELPSLCRKFEKVIVIATSVQDKPEQTRKLPENAQAFFIRGSEIKSAVRNHIGRLFFHIPPQYRTPQEKKAIGFSLPRRTLLSYFIAKGETVAQSAARLLDEFSVNDCEAVTFYSYWFVDTAVAALALEEKCHAKKKAAYCRAHGYDLYPERNPLRYIPLRPYLLKKLSGVFPCSENGSDYLRKSYPEYADKVSTSYLGTADHGLGPSREEKAFQLVSCCHIVPVKRVRLLAQALETLSDSGLALRWTHFGGGLELEELKQYAAEHLGFMHVEFSGEVTNAQLMDFYQSHHADLFVNTSSSEGLPVSVMEACSFGIPVMATDVGGTGEIVRDGENGVLLPADVTPETLAREIFRFCRKAPEERAAMRAAARKRWEEDFSAETNYSRFAEQISLK